VTSAPAALIVNIKIDTDSFYLSIYLSIYIYKHTYKLLPNVILRMHNLISQQRQIRLCCQIIIYHTLYYSFLENDCVRHFVRSLQVNRSDRTNMYIIINICTPTDGLLWAFRTLITYRPGNTCYLCTFQWKTIPSALGNSESMTKAPAPKSWPIWTRKNHWISRPICIYKELS